MREYELSMDEQIKLIVKKIDSLDRKFDEKFGAIDGKFDAIDKKFDAIDKKFDAMDGKLDAMDEKFDTMLVRLDDTHAVAKLGLEGLQGLRESMDEKFKAAAKTSAGHTDMLQSVLIHVRKRVEVLERPKRRS
jgi:chromosome segregation ATPase